MADDPYFSGGASSKSAVSCMGFVRHSFKLMSISQDNGVLAQQLHTLQRTVEAQGQLLQQLMDTLSDSVPLRNRGVFRKPNGEAVLWDETESRASEEDVVAGFASRRDLMKKGKGRADDGRPL